MIIAGAAATLAGLLAERPHTLTTTLGVLDVTTTVVSSDEESATIAMSWANSRDETQGLVMRLDNSDVSTALHTALFGDRSYISSLLSSYIESAARRLASDLTTYIPPHLDVDAVCTIIESLERSDLYLLPDWEQKVRKRILAEQDAIEEDLESKIETSGAWSIVDYYAKKITRQLVGAHPELVKE